MKISKVIMGGLCVITLVIITIYLCNKKEDTILNDYYIKSNHSKVSLYDLNYQKKEFIKRGEMVKNTLETYENNSKEYFKIIYQNKEYLVLKDNLESNKENLIMEKKVYIRTPVSTYLESDDIYIDSMIKKGTKVDVIGYDFIDKNGNVNMYKIKYKDNIRYIYAKYTKLSKKEALKNYDENKTYKIHQARTDTLGGGSASNLDYYPYKKANFKDNVMPKVVKALYINGSCIKDISKYLKIADSSNINSFVVDIKDNMAPSYDSLVMKKYSKTSYKKALNKMDDYKSYIKKIKDKGYYVIGRITVFKDSYFAIDNKEDAIINSKTKKPFIHNGSYWPTAFSRKAWQYNVSLAKEAVTEMGFNEIQFDYVRFPDNTYNLEKDKVIDMGNKYNEDKASAIQNFLFYATDELHKLGVYVSADVFGESAHTYVTGYGQYFPAISNIVDVISAMPYPDHFNTYEYGFSRPVWTVPYKLLKFWGSNYVMKRQKEIPTPAKMRTWIQTYDAIRSPYVVYDTDKIKQQIKGLNDAGLKDGYMTWNAGSSLSKYNSVKKAF